MNRLFHEDDLIPVPLSRKQLPTRSVVLRHLLARKSRNKDPSDIYQETADVLYDIWDKADCCPKTRVSIRTHLEKLYKDYQKLTNTYNDDGTKRSKVKKKKPDDSSNASPDTKRLRSTGNKLMDVWRTEFDGDKLFDIMSEEAAAIQYFDDEFYKDQKKDRDLHVVLRRVTTEFLEQEERQRERFKRSSAYVNSTRAGW